VAVAVMVPLWLIGNGSVASRWARLVLGWVTVGVQVPVTEIYLGLTNHPDQLTLAILP